MTQRLFAFLLFMTAIAASAQPVDYGKVLTNVTYRDKTSDAVFYIDEDKYVYNGTALCCEIQVKIRTPNIMSDVRGSVMVGRGFVWVNGTEGFGLIPPPETVDDAKRWKYSIEPEHRLVHEGNGLLIDQRTGKEVSYKTYYICGAIATDAACSSTSGPFQPRRIDLIPGDVFRLKR